ncbi:MAG: hypothetical protein JSU86_20365 [Phycisphaerales bacterium]|nr:MAG: hypothetical protein JSU86_20365 [Phycisphaerales bacterium]
MATSYCDNAWINRQQQDVSAYVQRVTRGGPNENWDSQSTVCACKSAHTTWPVSGGAAASA